MAGGLLAFAALLAVVGLWPVALLIVLFAVATHKTEQAEAAASLAADAAATEKDAAGCLASSVAQLVYGLLVIVLVIGALGISMGAMVQSDQPVPAAVDRLVPRRGG